MFYDNDDDDDDDDDGSMRCLVRHSEPAKNNAKTILKQYYYTIRRVKWSTTYD